MHTFAERVKHLRMECNFSLRQLASLTGISHSEISAYEKGKRVAGFESLEALCDVFNCDIDYILGRSDVKNSEAQKVGASSLYEAHIKNLPPEPKLSEEEKEMLDIFRLIPDDMQRVFLEMGRAYANSLRKE